MAENVTKVTYSLVPGGVGLGVWWFVWGVKGFWWGVWYGMFWPVWAGYHLAIALTTWGT
jgi:hypothetical protein